VSALPYRNVFDLDAITGDGPRDPFIAIIGGQEFVFADVRQEDWQLNEHLRARGDGREVMRKALGDEQWQRFLALPSGTVSDRKLGLLADKVSEYYGDPEDNA
jgi:hypothetical protein